MLARDYSTPPPVVNKLTLVDFAQLIDAIDAQVQAGQHHAARDGR